MTSYLLMRSRGQEVQEVTEVMPVKALGRLMLEPRTPLTSPMSDAALDMMYSMR